MKRLIVTDSTADIPEDLLQKYAIKVLPVNLDLDGRVYRDGIDISREVFYNSYDNYHHMASESVRYEDYGLEFVQMVRKYDEILIIHCSSHLSATYQTAVDVNREFGREAECRVEILDSGQCSMGLGLIVLAAAEASIQGVSFERLVSIAGKTRRRMRSYMAIPTLKYLKKNKKIGGMKALFGTAMGVKPVLEMDGGRMVIKSKLFGEQKNMVLAMMENIKEEVGGRPITLSIVYAGNRSLVHNLKEVFASTFDCRDIYISRFGPSIAINTGPESYAVFFASHD